MAHAGITPFHRDVSATTRDSQKERAFFPEVLLSAWEVSSYCTGYIKLIQNSDGGNPSSETLTPHPVLSHSLSGGRLDPGEQGGPKRLLSQIQANVFSIRQASAPAVAGKPLCEYCIANVCILAFGTHNLHPTSEHSGT